MPKSSLPPNQDQKKYLQDEEKGKGRKNKNKRSGTNRGYDEDQPGHPVRTTGSMRPDQESDLSTRNTIPDSKSG